jgi:hypothetical protein
MGATIPTLARAATGVAGGMARGAGGLYAILTFGGAGLRREHDRERRGDVDRRVRPGRGASGTTSFRGGWLYARLPLLLHPGPESALVIGFGIGNTLGAASLHPLETLDGVERSSEVVRAAGIFRETNHDVAANPDVRIVIEDGRNDLLGTSKTYDVITEEPPLVHTAGVVNLYSRDFYELCRDRLTEA